MPNANLERLDLSEVFGPSPGYAYATIARRGATVYSAGAVPLDRTGTLVGRGNLEEQTRAAVANLETALDRAGALPDVVKTTIYVVRREHQLHEMLRGLLTEASGSGIVRNDLPAGELATYCLHALGAARRLSSKAAVRRLVEVTLDGLRPHA